MTYMTIFENENVLRESTFKAWEAGLAPGSARIEGKQSSGLLAQSREKVKSINISTPVDR